MRRLLARRLLNNRRAPATAANRRSRPPPHRPPVPTSGSFCVSCAAGSPWISRAPATSPAAKSPSRKSGTIVLYASCGKLYVVPQPSFVATTTTPASCGTCASVASHTLVRYQEGVERLSRLLLRRVEGLLYTLLFGAAECSGLVVHRIRVLGRCEGGAENERHNDRNSIHRRRHSSQHTDQLTKDYTLAGSRRSLGASYREKAVQLRLSWELTISRADASDARHPAGRICCSCCLYVVVDPLVSRGLEGTLLLSEQRYTGYCIRTLEHPYRTHPGEQGLTGNRLSRVVLGVIDYGMPG